MKSLHAAAASILLLVLAGLIGCNTAADRTEPADEPQETVTEQQTAAEASGEYQIRGEVVAVDRETRSVTLDHEEIDGLMEAMTMRFEVADSGTLEEIEEGDRVEGRLVEREGQYVITQLGERAE